MWKKDAMKHVGHRPAVIWNVAEMITLYGTVSGIEVSREEIALLITARTVRRGRHEKTIMVSDRIILNPFTAKRLLVLMRKIMARHELTFGRDSSDLRAFMETTN